MKFSEIKKIKSFCEELSSNPCWKEVTKEMVFKSCDFEVYGVRFIEDDVINDALIDQLSWDEYGLGCFSAWAISDATDWPIELIKLAQNHCENEALGKAMTKEHIEKLAEIAVSHDGYGHFFNSYDGSEEEITIDGVLYHVFDVR